MKLKAILFLLLGFQLVLVGCQTTSDAGEPFDEEMKEKIQDTVDQVEEELASEREAKKALLSTDGILGMVKYLAMEGGFYGIVGEDGKNYLPLNLEEAYQQDSLNVRFTFERREGVMTIAMWGQAVDITAIERVE